MTSGAETYIQVERMPYLLIFRWWVGDGQRVVQWLCLRVNYTWTYLCVIIVSKYSSLSS